MRVVKWCCLLFPAIGIFIAIAFWIAGKAEKADELIFACFAGLFINLLIFLPAAVLLRIIFF